MNNFFEKYCYAMESNFENHIFSITLILYYIGLNKGLPLI